MSSIFKNAFLRRRSIISLGSATGSAIAIPKSVSRFLLPTPGSHIPMRTAAQQSHAQEERKPRNSPSSTLSPSFFETQHQNLLELTQPKKEPSNEQLVMEILSDFAEKHSGLPSFVSELQNLLASARLKELGVGFNPVPIPDKQDWKASWHNEGKRPNWLGTARTRADDRFYFSASITGYVEEEKTNGGGGYGVILFDNYGSPRVASVGVSPQRHVPLLYYELQGYRSALQLASEYGSGIILQSGSYEANRILELCRESMSYGSACGSNIPVPGDPVCTCCMGRHLYNVVDDFDVLFPVIKEIVEFLCKVEWYANIQVRNCSASGHLAKCYSIMPSTEEMGLFKLLDKDLKLYEMVMKPGDKFPEEVEDAMYDEVFKGGRIHSDEVMFDLTMHPEELFRKYRASRRQ